MDEELLKAWEVVESLASENVIEDDMIVADSLEDEQKRQIAAIAHVADVIKHIANPESGQLTASPLVTRSGRVVRIRISEGKRPLFDIHPTLLDGAVDVMAVVLDETITIQPYDARALQLQITTRRKRIEEARHQERNLS